jgi:acyl-coenzyme A thioesterase PaaI-like protein
MRAAVVGEPEHLMFTGRLEVRFRNPVPVGIRLRLVGRLVERRGRAARAHGEVLLPDGRLGAEVDGLFVDHPDSGMDSQTLAALGWRVLEE